jgi:hypothetical protein
MLRVLGTALTTAVAGAAAWLYYPTVFPASSSVASAMGG